MKPWVEVLSREGSHRIRIRCGYSPAYPIRLGPISYDLRRVGTRWWQLRSKAAFDVWCGAAESLGLHRTEWGRHAPDISSEAIEHAEALGL